jgi:hypothetical protein
VILSPLSSNHHVLKIAYRKYVDFFVRSVQQNTDDRHDIFAQQAPGCIRVLGLK